LDFYLFLDIIKSTQLGLIIMILYAAKSLPAFRSHTLGSGALKLLNFKFIKTIGKVSPENLDLLIEFASKATNVQFKKLKEIIS
jgi:hypothetical protein